EKQTVLARRRPNAEYRTREYLTEHEVENLIDAVKGNRNGHRDATMILICYRHGLRAAELCDLRWDQVEVETGRLHVRRRKNGTPSVHPLSGRELRALRRLQRGSQSPFVFVSERGTLFTAAGFQKLVDNFRRSATYVDRILKGEKPTDLPVPTGPAVGGGIEY